MRRIHGSRRPDDEVDAVRLENELAVHTKPKQLARGCK